LYPSHVLPQDEPYVAVAQVRESANLAGGILRLEKLLLSSRPKEPGFHYELAEAMRNAGRPRQAIAYYEQALERSREFTPALRGLAAAWLAAGEINVRSRCSKEQPPSTATMSKFSTGSGLLISKLAHLPRLPRPCARRLPLTPTYLSRT
jgi:hypothetical protein